MTSNDRSIPTPALDHRPAPLSQQDREILAYSQSIMQAIAQSPSPYHCVATMSQKLLKHGYVELSDTSSWSLTPGAGYFLRKHGTIIAFRLPQQLKVGQPTNFRIVGAHTDSPGLKLKPNPDVLFGGYLSAGVEVYGGVLLSTWFDRDLGLAGQVSYLAKDGSLTTDLLQIADPIASIPSLAIHLNRTVNESRSINPQTEMLPLLSQGKVSNLNEILKHYLPPGSKLLSSDLFFYDLQRPSLLGFNQEFIASARLDNQLSCFVGLQSLIEAPTPQDSCLLLVCNDHEEVGSASNTGAAGPLLTSALKRIIGQEQDLYYQSMALSMLVSVDNAHALHPNYRDKHDGNHAPVINKGVVLKINANQRYASSNRGLAQLKMLGDAEGISLQPFVTRTDMACGSTIGPITAALIGVETVDLGVPTFAMHSIREFAGTKDIFELHQLLRAYYG